MERRRLRLRALRVCGMVEGLGFRVLGVCTAQDAEASI